MMLDNKDQKAENNTVEHLTAQNTVLRTEQASDTFSAGNTFSQHILEETAKLSALADKGKAEKLEKYYKMVLDYNEKVNLTAITEQEDFLQKHFLDSLALIADKNVSRETYGGKTGKKVISKETYDSFGNPSNVSRETLLEENAESNVSRETSDSKEGPINDCRVSSENASIVSRETIDGKNVEKNVSRETFVKQGAKIIDVGTGAGFPGIPLAIFREDIKVTLLDSLNKRVSFLQQVIKELGLKKCEAVHARAEDLAHQEKYRETYDICVSRAVAALPVLCEYCLPFVKKRGFFVSYKASGADEEVRSAAKAITVLGGKLQAIETVKLPGTDIERKLIIIKKTENTPKKYPRKAGTPTKSPL